ncbi:MAG: YihA family ribosome biogenesis GTP-binding protein [Bacteroidetes bacterium HGW-Bacteroidetes-6]|jgi:GTP-binding protein|nr:MAG: YihA family ribosome biogenesis GTP-binding protein [Bacteroidetes bacterium HGW-Bacteroidetes-6]
MNAKYIGGCTHWTKCPAPDYPEYAFTGRSNVGKSSLINAMTGIKKLAKISSNPGKTQIINHFLIEEEWFLTDLPGYGYAKAPKELRKKWEAMIKEYLERRANLMTTFVLVDSRLEPQKNDVEFIDWCGQKQLPIAIIFTKADKCTKNELAMSIGKFEKKMAESWEEMPPRIITSSETRLGLDEVLSFIAETNRYWVCPEKR